MPVEVEQAKAPANAQAASSAGNEHGTAPRIRTINFASIIVASLVAAIAIIMLVMLLEANARTESMHIRYEKCAEATTQLMEASDYLTSQSRMHVVTGDPAYMMSYLTEIEQRRTRDKALETLQGESSNNAAFERLTEALQESNELAERELYAMRLVVDAQEGEYSSASSTAINPDDGSSASMPKSLAAVQIDPADASLSPEEKTAKARDMLLGTEYRQMKDLVVEDVEACANELLQELESQEKAGDESVQNLLLGLSAIIVLLVVMQTSTQYVNYVLVMRPMRIHARNIQDNEPLDLIGSRELQYVARSYNTIYEENHRRTMLLRREAETDMLTGLLNRGSYDKLLSHHGEDIALVIIDVDYFKQVNDTYGHGEGDLALKKVATAIKHSFRASDYVCRIGGDEFAVIMTEMQPIMRPVVESKLDQITEILQNTDDGLPVLTLSTGIAFSSELPPGSDIYQAADKALYTSKHHGRNQYSFYGDGE